MPSRPIVAVIVLFWLAVLAVVANRELVPRFFGDEPPAPEFVAVDELSQATVSWAIYRQASGEKEESKIGSMTSRTEYVPADDSFRFVNTYRGVTLGLFGVELAIPTATNSLRVDRAGNLKEQSVRGTAELDLGKWLPNLERERRVLSATADVQSAVVDGMLQGTATLTAPGLIDPPATAEFTPVPVPHGQVMNPLMPIDRLRGVVPGRRWAVRQVDPLRTALSELLVKELQERFSRGGGKHAAGVTLPPPPELLAEVLRDPVRIARPDGEVPCWVIEYRSTDPPITARTYVRRDDGRVLRQEATAYGERIRFEREE